MPSLSPSPASPAKRPSTTHRNSSTQSLSSSGKQAAHKVHRPHVVAGRGHGRNVSYGRNLSKLGKINSSANLAAETRPGHTRKKSSTSTPSTSPRAPSIKRNSSHVFLPKNTSHSNLRKNHSATTLARSVSHQALKKAGLAPLPKQKDKDDHKGPDVFKLGDQSSDEDEEEAEWEDSTTQSPELTRNNSKASTPARVITPNEERLPQKPPKPQPLHQEKTSSPPAPLLRNNNRSAPNLAQRAVASSPNHQIADPSLLLHNPRSSRAPPAMSTISAHATPQLNRTNSSKSFTHVTHSEANSPEMSFGTPRAGASSSAEGGVSHFLTSTTRHTKSASMEDGSDYDSPANFLPNYKPLASESPEKSRGSSKANLPHIASRTQQKLELQRRETMRGGAPTPATPPSAVIGFSLGSSASLHGRSGSRGQNRSAAGEAKAMKRDYEAGAKQLSIVRRFRNPIVESLQRLKGNGALPNETGAATPGVVAATKLLPPGRHGKSTVANGVLKTGLSQSFEERKQSPMASRSSSRGRSGKMVFPRQGSHDDIALSRSKGSEEGDEEVDGMSREEAIIRRIWETREVFDRPASAMGISQEGVEVG